ncbi:MAG: class I SAM-dependent methyltransferase [Verrucomicrobia subdivision 3 bacterium]|nr:class I SAM-dependent methyltransferase [Verrucomicrobiota bacterium]MCC6820046.1 class I SAM-dependent methyltransferase [Limisphaerales bacterium]
MNGWIKRIIPRQLTSRLRAARAYLQLRPEKRALIQEIITSGGGLHGESFRFFEDGLCTIHNADFADDARFIRAYAAGEATGSWKGWPLRWRAYLICWCAEWATKMDGDFVECGVNKGGNARMIIEYLGHQSYNRNFYLLDTFEGFSKDLLLPEEEKSVAARYRYPNCLEEVRKTFAPYPFVKIIPGTVPATLPEIEASRIAFLSIDMNCVAPEIEAATYLWDRLVPGGIIILDDYGFSQHHLQKAAFDHFAEAKGVRIMSLPTGQGLIFKPMRLAAPA